jgi:hypothetical protein
MGIYMTKFDVYLYGMILATNSFLLKNEYPEADTYGEIKESISFPEVKRVHAQLYLNRLDALLK